MRKINSDYNKITQTDGNLFMIIFKMIILLIARFWLWISCIILYKCIINSCENIIGISHEKLITMAVEIYIALEMWIFISKKIITPV